ncbi:MAG: 3-isopropylmalate/(R)-2-methylmalate dehydratase large subunit, partial [Mycobacterium sp.]|nr:3-isopropylmalate/(R)-2-methylmalate dehydratase large subunit [Mycobacterium sp.]
MRSKNWGELVTENSVHDATVPRTLAQKVWDDHVVVSGGGTEPDVIYI